MANQLRDRYALSLQTTVHFHLRSHDLGFIGKHIRVPAEGKLQYHLPPAHDITPERNQVNRIHHAAVQRRNPVHRRLGAKIPFYQFQYPAFIQLAFR